MSDPEATSEAEIDPIKVRAYAHFATRYYLLAGSAAIFAFIPAAAPWRWAPIALLVVALAIGVLYTVLAVKAHRAFTRAALRLLEEGDPPAERSDGADH